MLAPQPVFRFFFVKRRLVVVEGNVENEVLSHRGFFLRAPIVLFFSAVDRRRV